MNLVFISLFIYGLFNEAINSSVYVGMLRKHSGPSEKFFWPPEQGQTGLQIFTQNFY